MTLTRRQFCSLALVLLVGCQQASTSSPSTPTLPTAAVQLGNKTFTLEIAANDENRERGLMRRDSMAADHGMIFVFPSPSNVGFYMKNTRIQLDIVFLDQAGGVISIKQMKPYDLSSTSADGPAKWAIELNKDAASDAGLKVGDKVQIPESARAAEP